MPDVWLEWASMEENQTKPTAEMSDSELYRIAIDTRNLEIRLFWRRSTYFLVLSIAVALAYFALPKTESCLRVVLAIFGIGVSVIWRWTNLGGKYWQIRWEAAADRLEQKVAPDAHMFSAIPEETDREVWAFMDKHRRKQQHFLLDKAIARAPSVSRAMVSLASLFCLGWIALFVIAVAHVIHCALRRARASSHPHRWVARLRTNPKCQRGFFVDGPRLRFGLVSRDKTRASSPAYRWSFAPARCLGSGGRIAPANCCRRYQVCQSAVCASRGTSPPSASFCSLSATAARRV